MCKIALPQDLVRMPMLAVAYFLIYVLLKILIRWQNETHTA